MTLLVAQKFMGYKKHENIRSVLTNMETVTSHKLIHKTSINVILHCIFQIVFVEF